MRTTLYNFGLKSLALVSGLFVLASYATAQQTLLFEISKKGEPTSYLYGTMHMKDENFQRCETKLAEYVKKCDVFSGELDLENVQPTAEMAMAMMMVTTSLKSLYADVADYNKVKAYLDEKFGDMAAQIAVMKPFWIMSTLTSLEQGANMNKEDIVDVRLQKAAAAAGLAVKPLETIEEQLNAINAISLKEQAEMLLEYIEDETTHNTNDMMEQIKACYAKSDLSCLETVYNENQFGKEAEGALIIGRNKTMIERLSAMMSAGKSVFCAVGALHLPGEQGLITLLRNSGYTVTPVNYMPCR